MKKTLLLSALLVIFLSSCTEKKNCKVAKNNDSQSEKFPKSGVIN